MLSTAEMSDAKTDLIEAACAFWFNDNERVRTPFPEDIQPQVKEEARNEYMQWLENLTQEDKREVDDDELASTFEMFLFGAALKIVGEDDLDLVLTIHHPFMPRVGDAVDDATHGKSRILSRKLDQKGEEDKNLYMVVTLQAEEAQEPGETWQTEFLIPA